MDKFNEHARKMNKLGLDFINLENDIKDLEDRIKNIKNKKLRPKRIEFENDFLGIGEWYYIDSEGNEIKNIILDIIEKQLDEKKLEKEKLNKEIEKYNNLFKNL